MLAQVASGLGGVEVETAAELLPELGGIEPVAGSLPESTQFSRAEEHGVLGALRVYNLQPGPLATLRSAPSGEFDAGLAARAEDVLLALLVFLRGLQVLQHERRFHRAFRQLREIRFVIHLAAAGDHLQEVHI